MPEMKEIITAWLASQSTLPHPYSDAAVDELVAAIAVSPPDGGERIGWLEQHVRMAIDTLERDMPDRAKRHLEHALTPLPVHTGGDMREALHNLISLAKPYFTDEVQMLALAQAEAALTPSPARDEVLEKAAIVAFDFAAHCHNDPRAAWAAETIAKRIRALTPLTRTHGEKGREALKKAAQALATTRVQVGTRAAGKIGLSDARWRAIVDDAETAVCAALSAAGGPV